MEHAIGTPVSKAHTYTQKCVHAIGMQEQPIEAAATETFCKGCLGTSNGGSPSRKYMHNALLLQEQMFIEVDAR